MNDDDYFKEALNKAARRADEFIKDMRLRRAQEELRRSQNDGGVIIEGEYEVINPIQLGEHQLNEPK